MPEFPEGSEWSQIKAELNYVFTPSRKATLSKTKTKQNPLPIYSKAIWVENLLSCSSST